MVPEFLPEDQVFWYLNAKPLPRLQTSLKADVVIVGGGMAGISAAQSFQQKGMKVVLLEKGFCGSGASGKSSGFITPDSELSLSELVNKYGPNEAQKIWQFVEGGVNHIRKNITEYSLTCDYSVQDTCVLADSSKAFRDDIEKEHTARRQFGYASNLFDKNQVTDIVGSESYYGAVSYPGSFGISGFQYCQLMKMILKESGVAVYEESPVISLEDHKVHTSCGSVEADHIILCTDRFTPDLGKLTSEMYHVQTILMMSAPLSDAEIRQLFPRGNLMVWDTDLIYHYFRICQNNRLLLGGASLLLTYAKKAHHDSAFVYRSLNRYVKKKFPQLTVNFEYMWPGLIGITKDIMPIAGRDEKQPSIYYVVGSVGLPWAAALGNYAADSILNGRTDFDKYFSPQRSFFIGPVLQKVLGKRISFALSNFSVVGTL
jgi:gamma-glutamylputrescine oxidase